MKNAYLLTDRLKTISQFFHPLPFSRVAEFLACRCRAAYHRTRNKQLVFVRTLRVLSLGCALCVLAVGCTTTVRQHPSFVEKKAGLRTIALPTPETEIVLVKFTGDNEPLYELQDRVRDRLTEELTVLLKNKNFTVVNETIEASETDQGGEIRFIVTTIKRELKDELHEMYRVPQMGKRKAMNYEAKLGPNINILSDHYCAGTILFAYMDGFKKTGGEVAKDFMKSLLIAAATGGNTVVYSDKGAALIVALVDGTTGDILWTNMATTTTEFENRGLTLLAKKVLTPLLK